MAAVPDKLSLNRSRTCKCCDQRMIREHRRVGIPGDPDYAVAVCPVCDLTPAPVSPPVTP